MKFKHDATKAQDDIIIDRVAEIARARKARCASALTCAAKAPAAPGWHPQDAPGLVALAFGSSATAIRTTGNQKI